MIQVRYSIHMQEKISANHKKSTGCKKAFEDNSKGCEVCSHGYYRIAESSSLYTCKTCDTECATCENGESCASCKSGYYLKDGKCSKCSAECEECDASLTCLDQKCPLGQDSNPEGCKICDVLHCQKCETDLKVCDECFAGTFLADKNNCQHCPTGCKACTSESKCTECHDNYELKEGKCSEKGSNLNGLWIFLGLYIGFLVVTISLNICCRFLNPEKKQSLPNLPGYDNFRQQQNPFNNYNNGLFNDPMHRF